MVSFTSIFALKKNQKEEPENILDIERGKPSQLARELAKSNSIATHIILIFSWICFFFSVGKFLNQHLDKVFKMRFQTMNR